MITKLCGILLISLSLALVYLFESSNGLTGAFRLFHWPAMVLTGFGPIGIILICSDWKEIQETLRLLFRTSLLNLRRKNEENSKNLHTMSQRYYLHGAKVFEEFTSPQLSPYLQRTLKRLSVRIPIADVRNLLGREAQKANEKSNQVIAIANLGVRMAPSVGMLGTILGMVQLLASLKDPSHIGSHMSLALLTTFYGLFFSLVLWTPIVQHLKALREAELNGYEQVLHWLELLEERKPTQYLSEQESAGAQS